MFGSTGGSSLFGATPAPAPSPWGATPQNPAAAGGQPAAPVTLETPYTKLPPEASGALDALWNDIAKQRQLALHVSKADDSGLKELEKHMKGLTHAVQQVQNTQTESKVAVSELDQLTQDLTRDVERHGRWSLEQLLHPTGLRTAEELPSPFIKASLAKFEARLASYMEEIEQIEKQLLHTYGAGSEGGRYGQADRITAAQLAELMRSQHDAFMRVAGGVATAHEQMSHLRHDYKMAFQQDPFAAADRAEAEETRRIGQQLKLQGTLALGAQPPAQAPAPAPAPLGTTTGLLGAPAPAPAAATGLGLGLGAPAAAPAPSTGFGFGAAPAGGSLFGGGALTTSSSISGKKKNKSRKK